MTKPIISRRWSPFILALRLAALFSGACYATDSMDVSEHPDTRTRFIWLGEGKTKNPDTQLYISVKNGGSSYGTNATGAGLDIRFDKNDLKQLKWCAQLATTDEMMNIADAKKCTPNKPLTPGGEIKLP